MTRWSRARPSSVERADISIQRTARPRPTSVSDVASNFPVRSGATGRYSGSTSVSTRRQDRINSNAEERQRHGYEIRSAYRFAEVDGRPSIRTAVATDASGETIAHLAYGHTTTLWLINVGWARRKDRNEHGFMLDLERGQWASRPEDSDTADDDPLTGRLKAVVPYVEDRRNVLVFDPIGVEPTPAFMASLQVALKIAIQAEFDLEDSELAVVSLPDRDQRTSILLYEAAEGGAGVLRQLVEDEQALTRVARQALERCHFDPDTLADMRRAPRAREDCEAACYDCLLSYTNQPDHQLVDRQLVADYLHLLANRVGRLVAGERDPLRAP